MRGREELSVAEGSWKVLGRVVTSLFSFAPSHRSRAHSHWFAMHVDESHHGARGYRNPWPSAHAPLSDYVPSAASLSWPPTQNLPIDFERPLDMTGLKSIRVVKPDFSSNPDDGGIRATWIGHAVGSLRLSSLSMLLRPRS
jgi:hypothetical protein